MADEINEEDYEEDPIHRWSREVVFKKLCETTAPPMLLFASIMEMFAEPTKPNFFTLFPSLSPENVLLEGTIAAGAIGLLYVIHKGNQAQQELDRLQNSAIPVIDLES
jgi:hypothetical protein